MTVGSSALPRCPSHSLLSASRLVKREQRKGLDLVTIGPPDNREFQLTLHPLPGENLADMFCRLSDILLEHNARPVQQFVFGSLETLRHGEEALRRVFVETDWPITWVDGNGCADHPVAGMQVVAVSPRRIKRIKWNGRVVGCIFNAGAARHCLLGGLGPTNIRATKPEQTVQTLANLEAVLHENGFTLGDVMRTWFYLDDILSWYGDFNKARSAFYDKRTFRIRSLPASTGVSGKNPAGAALAMAAWAVQPLKNSLGVREIASPMQCPAPAYGSSFSRAVEIDSPQGRRILISGTASIAPGGKTLWLGDVRQQVELTMEVVEAILKSRGLGFEDTTRAIAYFKNPGDLSVFADWSRRHEQSLPVVPVHCDICRDDLLFEIELDAVTTRAV